ncbi:glycosyltransferase family 2 protein [Methylocaldum sp. RMAD-M]|uniref:glycosyltransferase family 2 protein n=1 Tax=Methylocaldum sp. RMAD-M TaxID=2806557 RepID=UPI001AE632AF|nr:glycosyltransferase family 2 protein [Methylocaldum sp. RMAD-M]MBP1150391.1 GT2 family glycosyltransferase [Methylocaldum sp. RMAD-M]
MASVTLVIVNWNAGQWLPQCIQKALDQTVKPEQIIVVDNASTDGSLKTLAAWSEITIVQMSRNTGFAYANNAAFSRCNTKYVALLNPDAFPARDWLERLLTAATATPQGAAFGSRQMMAETPDRLDGRGDVYHASGLFWRAGHGHRCGERDLMRSEIFSPCAGAALYRRDALVAVNGFDSDFFCYAEDVDLGFRLRLAGHSCHYVPEAVVYHIGSATTGGQQSDFSVYHGHRNLVWTFVKNMPGALFWLLLPMHVLLNLVTVVWFTARGQGRVILRAKWHAIKGLPQAWAKRKKIQASRVATVREIWRVLDKRLIPSRRGR